MAEGVFEGDDNNQNDNDASGADAALARQEFDCDSNTQCANVWSITPTIPGRYTIWARLRDVNDVRTDWIGSASLRVRGTTGAGPTATVTATSAATATTGATATQRAYDDAGRIARAVVNPRGGDAALRAQRARSALTLRARSRPASGATPSSVVGLVPVADVMDRPDSCPSSRLGRPYQPPVSAIGSLSGTCAAFRDRRSDSTVSTDAGACSTALATLRASTSSGPRSTEVDSVVMKRIAVLVGFLVIGLVSAVAPPGRETEAQANCFQETGFCITNPAFAEYFRVRGGYRILGYPDLAIVHARRLRGPVLPAGRAAAAGRPGQAPERARSERHADDARQSVDVPGAGPADRVAGAAAIVADLRPGRRPVHPEGLAEHVQRPAGRVLRHRSTRPCRSTSRSPASPPNPDLVTLLNLEIWGLPTSKPAPDPGNGGFIYQRYQRGIMHFDASCGCTQGILVGEYFKSVITGKNLPPDLAADMQGSRYLQPVQPGNANWLARPAELPNTDMTGAFEPGTGRGPAGTGTGQPSQPKPGDPTTGRRPGPPRQPRRPPRPTDGRASDRRRPDRSGPEDPCHGDRAGHAPASTWIEWQGDDTGDPVLDDNHRYDGCDQRTECASSGKSRRPRAASTICARGPATRTASAPNGSRPQLRVREGPTATPTPTTPTPTPGPGTPTVTPTPGPASRTSSSSSATTPSTWARRSRSRSSPTTTRGSTGSQWEGDDSDDPELRRAALRLRQQEGLRPDLDGQADQEGLGRHRGRRQGPERRPRR